MKTILRIHNYLGKFEFELDIPAKEIYRKILEAKANKTDLCIEDRIILPPDLCEKTFFNLIITK